MLSGTPLAPLALRMIVNGLRPTSVPPTPDNNPSGIAAVESIDASGFSSLLFLILAAPQPAINAALTEGERNGNISASGAADDKSSAKLLAGNVAAVNGIKGIDEEDHYASCVAQSKSDSPLLPDPATAIASSKIVASGFFAEPDNDSRKALPESKGARFTLDLAMGDAEVFSGKVGLPGFVPESGTDAILAIVNSTSEVLSMPDPTIGEPELRPGEMGAPRFADFNDHSKDTIAELTEKRRLMPDPTIGQAEVVLAKSVVPGFFAEPDNNSRQLISPSTSDRGRSGGKPVRPIHGESADERKEAGSVVDRSDQQVSQLADNVSLSIFEKSAIAINRKQRWAGGVPGAAKGEETDSFNSVAEKVLEHSEPRPVKLVRGHMSKLLASPNYGAFSIDPSDGLDSEPILGPKFHFEKPPSGDTAEAEISSFTADPKDHEIPELSRILTQLPNETANPMVRATLPREGPSPAADDSTSTWRPTVERVTGEIVGHIQMNKREAILHLDPPELGKIKIDLHLKGDKLQAHIFTEAHEARSLIENHIQELRQALQANNLDLVDVRVQGGWHGAMGDAMHGFPQQQQQQPPAGQQEWGGASGNVDRDALEPQPNDGSTSEQGRVSMWA